jgi:pimeloyl-ACP methyl ester carboxylesterase
MTTEILRIKTDDGVALHVESTGQGPAILFVHEFAGDCRDWEPQVRHFSRSWRCVTFNARGYPPSDVPTDPAAYSQDRAVADVFAVLDGLAIDRAHVVGHSMGAYTMLHAAMRAPQRVISAVATGCGWGSDPGMHAEIERTCTGIARLFREGPMEKAARDYGSAPMRLAFRHKDPRGWEEFVARLAQHSAEGSALTMLGVQMRRPTLPQMEAGLRNLQVPLLVIVGDEDAPCLDGSVFLKRTAPQASLLVMPRTSHCVGSEEPALFNAALTELFAAAEHGRWLAHRR